jgi:hypothetical protein
MKQTAILVIAAIMMALASKAQQVNNSPVFTNEKPITVQKFNPQGYPSFKMDSIIPVGGLYLKIENEQLILSVPVSSKPSDVTGKTANFYLNERILSLEFSADGCNSDPHFILVLKLQLEDKKAFESFQKKIQPSADANFEKYYQQWLEKNKKK